MLMVRLIRRLQTPALRGPRAGLLNRRAAQQQLDQAWQRLQREGLPFSVLLLNVDHCKRINDRHEHAVGDTVLVGLAAVRHDRLRPADGAARVGGEELLAILQQTDVAAAGLVAERRRVAHWRLEACELSVTASIGVAEVSLSDACLDALLLRADRALYAAKNGGRTRVPVAPRLLASLRCVASAA